MNVLFSLLYRPAGRFSLWLAFSLQFVALMSAYCIGGCSGGASRGRQLPLIQEEFNAALRWGNLPVALQHLDPALAPDVGRHLRRVLSQVQILDVELQSIQMSADGKEAWLLVQFTWLNSGDIQVSAGEEVQAWELSGDRWVLKGQYVPDPHDGGISPFARKAPDSSP